MTRKSKREIETVVEELSVGDAEAEFFDQLRAVIDGDRERIDVEPPSDDFLTLLAKAAQRRIGPSLADAYDALADVEGLDPEPIADFTDTDP